MTNQNEKTPGYVLKKFSQFVFLTLSNFSKNNLWESASSCSFGFVFSFIPITLIITTFLVTILRVSPSVLQYVMSFADEIKSIVDITPVINNLLKVNSIKFMDFFLAVWVIWMARKMFLSIIQAMTRIFGSVNQRKSFFNQLMTFISEFTLVLIFAAVILVTFVLNRILRLPIFEYILNSFPSIFRYKSNLLVMIVMYVMLFIYVLYVYKVLSGTKPMFKRCVFYAALNTGTFFVFSYFINKFLNVTNYNIIYGTISTLVVLMMKVYFFFVIFLFYAQMIYVSQFFDSLLIAEIYLLPSRKKTVPIKLLQKASLFDLEVLKHTGKTFSVNKGEVIFSKSLNCDKVFYLKKGSVTELTDLLTVDYDEGNFFGEISCIINQFQRGTAMANTDCTVIEFDSEFFRTVVSQNPLIAANAIAKSNSLTSKTEKLLQDFQ